MLRRGVQVCGSGPPDPIDPYKQGQRGQFSNSAKKKRSLDESISNPIQISNHHRHQHTAPSITIRAVYVRTRGYSGHSKLLYSARSREGSHLISKAEKVEIFRILL